jgi:site-specific DNA recombinase
MRRGRQAKLRAGTLLPWTTPPFGYRLDPERPRDGAGVRVEQAEAVLVTQLFDWYLQPQATVYRLTKRLTDLGVPTPTGKPRWNAGERARHLAQPGLYRPGANQPHPGGAGPAAQVRAAAGRPG